MGQSKEVGQPGSGNSTRDAQLDEVTKSRKEAYQPASAWVVAGAQEYAQSRDLALCQAPAPVPRPPTFVPGPTSHPLPPRPSAVLGAAPIAPPPFSALPAPGSTHQLSSYDGYVDPVLCQGLQPDEIPERMRQEELEVKRKPQYGGKEN